jgi:hypothetical protein
MRSELLAHRLDVRRHLGDVALEAVEVEQEGRGRDLGSRHGVASIPRPDV